MSSSGHHCPRCRTFHAGVVPEDGILECSSCANRWRPAIQASDEYAPLETSAVEAKRPLTTRRAPAQAMPVGATLPFDQLEASASAQGERRPSSDLAFRPSTEQTNGRTNCPVCGHSFVPLTASDAQKCPQCGTAFSRASGRLSAGGTNPSGDQLIGRVLRGCMIDRKLGEGGMGAVYHARQLSLDRSVAIKVLPPELARNKNFISRFEREAKSLARINHANILQIYDFGDDPQLGIYFMVIEYVDGWDLGELLRRQPTLSQIETVDIIRQALLGLEQAADKGVIHRDIKPDNLMVSLSGLCKVSDFGLAKGSASDSEVTSVGVRVGTPAFMSPEQCDGVEVDSRSDVYNLGCTAYLMLTGRLPYDGETPFSIMLKHKVDPVPMIATHRPDIDPRIDSLIGRMMAKSPADRCGDLRELIDEAEGLLVTLTGTASVLRKTNGPIRALVQHTSGQGSSGHRAIAAVDLPADGRAPIPGAQPSGRQRAQQPAREPSPPKAAPIPAIPEWLRPVDLDGPASPTPRQAQQVVGPPSGATPTIGSRTSQSRALGRRPEDAPPTLNTPFPGLVTPLPEARRAGSSSSSSVSAGVLDRARERGIRAEVASIAAGAERLAANGSFDAAASEWRRASALAGESVDGHRLADLAAAAARRARSRRRWRALAVIVGSLALIGVNLWIWPPVVHPMLADRERVKLEAQTDEAERSRSLREFAAANQGGWRWYRTLFGSGYEVPAAAAAAISADRPPPRARQPQPTERSPVAKQTPLDELARLVADPLVPWQRVADAARPGAVAGDATAAKVLADAEAQLAAAAQARKQIDTAIAQGRHGEALDAAARLITGQSRAGALLDGLPLPGRVLARDSDTGSLISDLRLSVDGAHIVGSDGRFCRNRGAETKLAVESPGYATQNIAVVADTDPAERIVEARLGPAPLWKLSAPNHRPAWLRLEAVGSSAAILTPDGLTVVDPATGIARPLTVPGTRLVPWWSPVDSGWAFCTADGEQRQLLSGLDHAVAVRRLGGAPLALLDIDLVYRAGGRLQVMVEDGADGRVLVAREGVRDAWRLTGIAGPSESLLRRVDDKIILVDDVSVRVIEEDGREASRQALRGPRLGPWAELPGGRLLIATAAGVDLVALGSGGARLVANPWLADAGLAVPAALGDTVVLARADRSVDIAQWATDPVQPRWRAKVAARTAVIGVGCGVAALVDTTGTITVLRLVDGVTLRRIAHGAPSATEPLILPGQLIVGDQTGAVTGYRLPTP